MVVLDSSEVELAQIQFMLVQLVYFVILQDIH